MNHVSLIGRLTKDLELRKVSSGTSVVTFILAVNRRFKAEGQPEADFIRCTAWGKTAEVMSQYLNKGTQIGVEGRIQTGQYEDKSGSMVYTTDIVVESFDFIGNKKESTDIKNMSMSNEEESLEITADDLPF